MPIDANLHCYMTRIAVGIDVDLSVDIIFSVPHSEPQHSWSVLHALSDIGLTPPATSVLSTEAGKPLTHVRDPWGLDKARLVPGFREIVWPTA